MLAAHLAFNMLPAACLMWPLFVVMPDLKLLSAFHRRKPSNVWVAAPRLQLLAALQRGLRVNVGSYDDGDGDDDDGGGGVKGQCILHIAVNKSL